MNRDDYQGRDDAVDYDFDQTPTTTDFQSVPPGTYLCRVDEARPGLTRDGHKRWALKFVIHDGPETGRIAAWDGIVFSPRAQGRTRQVLAALGLPHTGRVHLRHQELVGRLAYVTVTLGTYRNPENGLTVKRNAVPYDGVQPADGVAGEPDATNAEPDQPAIPF